MDLIKSLRQKFTPKYEVDSQRYFVNYLNDSDSGALGEFLFSFNWELSIPSAILAVGSSVFPKIHWKERRKLNRKYPGLNASETYQDIDLLLVPEKVTPLAELESAVQETLRSLDFPFALHESTVAGVSYPVAYLCAEDKMPIKTRSSFVHLDYGLHSVSTNLRNGTKLDLILGRDDLLTKTATQKIAEEREKNFAFSLLYNSSR